MKSEVRIDHYSKPILATATAPGRCHELRRRRQAGSRLPPDVQALVDWGYPGLQHEHRLTVLPFQATKKQPLGATQRAINRVKARLRIKVEPLIRGLKVFWILARPYRNRRRRFGWRLNLIAGLYHFDLDHA